MKLLEGRLALITGGTSGIGKAIAKLFFEQGAFVVIVGNNPSKGSQAIEEITGSNGSQKALFFQADVSDFAAVHELIEKIISTHGPIDLLVNSAGITRDKLLLKMDEADWDAVMATNAKSCYNTCHAVIRSMMKARRGKIINIGSVIGEIGNVGQANYAASKAAIVGFSKALAKEVASRNILVNVIAPGYIQTPMTAGLGEEQTNAIKESIPLGRTGLPEEIAATALFLAIADYITGQVIFVDGGMSI